MHCIAHSWTILVSSHRTISTVAILVRNTIVKVANSFLQFSDIIAWQPPTEPNGKILHYNIRIYRVDGDGNEELVDTVREVQATTFDFSTRGLSSGTYNIQVGCVSCITLKYNVV